jgi:hypothetical protein
MLQQQRQIMQGMHLYLMYSANVLNSGHTDQDERLEHLSRSVNRQHHISLQINDELEVHDGLLQGLEGDLDRTDNRLSSTRRQLDKFSKAARENGELGQ